LPAPRPEASISARIPDEEEREALLDETAILPADLGQGGFDVLPEGQHIITPAKKGTSVRSHAE